MIPQMVELIKLDDATGWVTDVKSVQRPTLGIFLEQVSSVYSNIIVDTEQWSVVTSHIGKGEDYAGKINRSL